MLNDKTKNTIHLIYGIFLSVVTVIAAICIMVSCVTLYQTDSYSREAVAEIFSKIAIPVYLCLATVIGGFILNLIFPVTRKKRTADKQIAMQLNRLHAKLDLTKCDVALSTSIYNEKKKRNLHFMIACILLAVGMIIFLPYGLNGSNYHQSDINSSMIKAVLFMAGCLILPFSYAVFASFYAKKSMERELNLLKQVKTFREETAPTVAAKKIPSTLIVQLVFLTLGVAFLLYGLFSGGVADVITKAINICTECIGLG